ncbi:MAG: hypothetical protein E7G42_01380 [Serratia marcescens]|nr:hypothetical protein [Serratia marcescens]MDU3817744.1 hypothetical protein [Pantoea sp.]
MAIISTQNNKKSPLNYCRNLLLIASVITVFSGTPSIAIAAQENPDDSSSKVSGEGSLQWTNQVTGKTIQVPKGWSVSMSLVNDRVFTLFHEDMSGAEITICYEETTDELERYVHDMLKLYPQRHIKITISDFANTDALTFWLADGEMENESDKRFRTVIYKKDGRMWITSANIPSWMFYTKTDLSDLIGDISFSAL